LAGNGPTNETADDRRNSPSTKSAIATSACKAFEAVATLADGPRTWVIGARAEAETFSQYLTKTDSLSTGLSTTTLQEGGAAKPWNAAIYGQLEWRLGKLTVLPGVRVEGHTRLRIGGGAAAGARVPARKGTRFAHLGGRGFRAPSSKELGFVFDHSFYGYRVLGKSRSRARDVVGRERRPYVATPSQHQRFGVRRSSIGSTA